MKRVTGLFWRPDGWNRGLTGLGFAICFTAVVVAFLAAVFTGVYFVSEASCDRVGDRMERETIYDFWGQGCFIETDDGRFIPDDLFRTTNEESQR